MRLSPSAKILLAANLVPAVGALVFGWEMRDLLLLYWAETLAVGTFSVMRLAGAPGPARRRRFSITVFGLHFGLFVALYWVLVSLLASGSLWTVPLGRIPVFAFLVFFVSHGLSYLDNYHFGDEFGRTTFWEESFWPYWRIIPTQAAAVAAYLAVAALAPEAGKSAALLQFASPFVVIAAKTAVDFFSHRAAHRGRSRPRVREMGKEAMTEQGLAMIAAAFEHKEEDVRGGRPLP